MDQIFFEDIHQQYENMKALIKEKGVDIILADDSPEALMALRQAWRKHEIKEMFDAMTGRLVARVQGMTPKDDHFYRLLGMQASLLYEEAKQLTSLLDTTTAAATLETALQMVRPYAIRIELVFLAMRIMNHYSYILVSRDENLDYAKALLQEAESVYNKLILSGKPASIFFNTDDLFSAEVEAEAHLPISSKLEKLATNNMQMLGYIYHKRGNIDKFVEYHHCVLNRHLELQDHDPIGWANKAERLATYFLRERRFNDARHHLTAAWTVVNRLERITKARKPTDHALAVLTKVDYTYSRLATTWVRYGSELFGYSRLALLRALGRGADEAIWGSSVRMPMHTAAEAAAADLASMNAASARAARGEQDITEEEEEMEATMMMPDDTCSDISLPAPRISGISIADPNIDSLGFFTMAECGSPDFRLMEEVMAYTRSIPPRDYPTQDGGVNPPMNMRTELPRDLGSNSTEDSDLDISFELHRAQDNGSPRSTTTEDTLTEETVTTLSENGDQDSELKVEELELQSRAPSEVIVSEVLDEITKVSSAEQTPAPEVITVAQLSADANPTPAPKPAVEQPKQPNKFVPPPQGAARPGVDQSTASESYESPPLIFEMLRLGNAECKVPADIIDSAQSARALFNHTYEMLKIAKRYHNVRDHPEDYEHWALTLCDLYDFLSFYEQDIYTQYELQRRRAETLETLTAALRRVRPDYYVHVSVELLRELAGAQLELLELNFRRLFCAQQPPLMMPQPAAAGMAGFMSPGMAAGMAAGMTPSMAASMTQNVNDIATAAGIGAHCSAMNSEQQAAAATAAAAHALNKLRAFADVKDRLDVFGEKQQQQMDQAMNLTAAGDQEQYGA